jgi:hypothetical protein
MKENSLHSVSSEKLLNCDGRWTLSASVVLLVLKITVVHYSRNAPPTCLELRHATSVRTEPSPLRVAPRIIADKRHNTSSGQ